MAQIERGEARIQRRISIKKALDSKVSGTSVIGFSAKCLGYALFLKIKCLGYALF